MRISAIFEESAHTNDYDTGWKRGLGMYAWVKRCMAITASMAGMVVGLWGYCYQQLPDTFLITQGQTLHLAQMPWLQPIQATGAAQANAVPSGNSYNVTLSAFGCIPIKTVRAVVVDERVVTVCGTPFGIKMFSEGAMVVGFTDIKQTGGSANPAKSAGLKMGDRILSIEGIQTHSNEDVAAAIQQAQGNAVQVVYSRNGQTQQTLLQPVQDKESGTWRAGMWVRDSSAGIGTLTFVDNNIGVYGGLGHSISDADTGESIALRSGEIAAVTITGYESGAAGTPGELKGRFTSEIAMGDIAANGSTGVYGLFYTIPKGEDMPVAQAQEVHEGKAQILTTIEGNTPHWYTVQIEKVSLTEEDPNRNMVLRVTDTNLLNTTGGIVQGMSGSPIVQDGKLVGAVTHVLVNDPTRGYGIFAENMLKTADSVVQEKLVG